MKRVFNSFHLPRVLIPLASLLFMTTHAVASPQSNQKHAARPPSGALINIDFNAVYAVSGPAVIGNGPTDYWNGYSAPYQTFGQVPDLYFSDGQLSGASLQVQNAPGAWDNEHPDSMMRTFIHSFGYQPIQVTLNNLPNGTYDVYIYAHGVLNQNAILSAQADGVTYGPESTTTADDWQSATWSEGSQYVLLKDVSVLGGSALQITAAPGATELGVLNGIQLHQTSQHAKKPKHSTVIEPPHHALLNLDFANTAPYSGVAAEGNGPADLWNAWYAPYQYFAERSGLVWATGEPSVVSATIENAPGAWVSEHPDGMMNTFTHSFGYQPILLTLSDLPNGTYDVYVYAHGVLNQNSRISASADGVTYGPESTTAGSEWLNAGWTEGAQYVLLEDVSVQGGSKLVIRSDAVDTELAVLSGVQLRQTSKHAKKVKSTNVQPLPTHPLLNIDLANYAPYTGPAATGEGPSDVWNAWYFPYQFYSEILDLKWSTGVDSAVSASIQNAPGAWVSVHPDGMLNTFAHSFNYQPILLTLSDLPNGTYDVYVYAHGEINQNSTITATADGVTYGPESTTTGADWLNPGWTEGSQYVRLTGVSVLGGSQLLIQAAPGATELGVISGIQLRQTSKHAKKVKPAKAPKIPKDALLNIDFASPTPWFGVAATGDGPADVWNAWYAPYQLFAESGDLKWSTGVSSGATASIQNAPGAWLNEHPDAMMSSFTHSFGYQPIVVTLSDLPSGTYDVYVYAHGVINQDSSITAVANNITYGPESTTSTDAWMSPVWTEGAQYVKLQNVTVPASGILVIQSTPISTELAVLNGVQLRRTSKQ